MAVLVTNDGASPYALPDRRTIAPGNSVVLSDEELRLIPDSKRGAGKLLISAVGGYVTLSPESKYILRLDDAGGVTYIGEALPGTASAAALWRIKQITETGSDLTLLWADGDESFDNVWNDRASLSYS